MTAPITPQAGPPTPSLESRIAAVAYARIAQALLNKALAGKLAAFDTEHAELLTMVRDAKGTVTQLEEQLRLAALLVYQETANKKPAIGVAIRVETQATVENEALAFGWCLEKRIALAIDKPTLKAMARAQAKSGGIPGVRVEAVPVAGIATDLPALLGIKIDGE